MSRRLVSICDWLPPDFGAVGQYAVLSAREWAAEGWAVTLVGLTSSRSSREPPEPVGEGSVEVVKVHRRPYQRQKFATRVIWTILSNVRLLAAAYRRIRG